ncbi:MAG TPA: cation diffusion facilitator family transporter [Dehalococcoidia bacterium]|nr:cation diffusion facilitator family transporter [Dehalococcoidia bacterium]
MGLWSDRQSRAASLSLVSNLVFLLLKLVAAIVTGSVAILGDALDSAEDLIASGVALFSVRLAMRPPDLEHPFGHGKVESLGTIFEAGVISVGAVFITITAIGHLDDENRDIETTFGLVVMLAAFVVNGLVARYVFQVANDTDSMILRADARHILTNMAQAATVAFALVLVEVTGNAIWDSIVALLLAAFLFYTAVQLLWTAIREVMDVSLPAEEIELISRVVDEEPEARGIHSLRARRSGPFRQIDMHVLMDPQITVAQSHDLIDRIEGQVRAAYPRSYVLIHADPDDGRVQEHLPEPEEDKPGLAERLHGHHD